MAHGRIEVADAGQMLYLSGLVSCLFGTRIYLTGVSIILSTIELNPFTKAISKLLIYNE